MGTVLCVLSECEELDSARVRQSRALNVAFRLDCGIHCIDVSCGECWDPHNRVKVGSCVMVRNVDGFVGARC